MMIESKKYDNSGCSCSVVIIIEEVAYIANTGDNRGLLSIANNKKVI